MEDHKTALEHWKGLRAHYLLKMVDSVKKFNGEVADLEPFVERMDIVHGLILENPLDEKTDRDLISYFVLRIEPRLLYELGIPFGSTWDTVKKTLYEHYTKEKKLIPASALRIFQMRKGQGESSAEFASRLEDAMQKLQAIVTDSCGDTEEGQWRMKIYEELAIELLVQSVPERVRMTVRNVNPTTLAETIRLVGEEEADREEPLPLQKTLKKKNWRIVKRKIKRT